MLKTEAIAKFLSSQPYAMCKQYKKSLEVQVNVARDDGEIVKGSYAGKGWQGFTDGLTTWKPFRIPWNAMDDPRYEDRPLRFDISLHAEAIGMTGWDWILQRSRWVGYDIDSIISHKEGLTGEELKKITDKLSAVEFVSIYTSTSGNGLHLYVFIENNFTVKNHTEHAAIARAILDKLSAFSGLKLEAKVDTFGGNMWVWHRKAGPRSFKLLKRGAPLTEIPLNWQNYLDIKRVTPKAITSQDLLVASHHQLTLSEEHLRLINWFERSDSLWWWDSSKNMLVCHTFDLKRAHTELKLKGIYETLATGKEQGNDQNCFVFPTDNGTWIIRRHGHGTKEHETWFTDTNGWTSIYFNKTSSLRIACKLSGGVEGEKDYSFKSLSRAIEALLALEIECIISPGYANRSAELKIKGDKIILSFKAHEDDEDIEGWGKVKCKWQKAFFRPQVKDEIELPDNTIRHLVSKDVAVGWFINTLNGWVQEDKASVSSVLTAQGFKRTNIESIFGKSILNHWKLVTIPFKPEYPGDRQWNKNAPQLRFNPQKGMHTHWDLILDHLGAGLDKACENNVWCKEYGIISGYMYLLAWIASLIQEPTIPLPYLTFTGPQNCGKSILHEALSILFTRGCIRADHALISPSGFNGELTNAILCIVEETDLSKRGFASDRIKDWVTGRTISIRAMYRQPFDIANCTHWIQCTNDVTHCPILPGDTRITLILVAEISTEVSKPFLLQQCEKEAPAFIKSLLDFSIPPYTGRLKIPVLTTESKKIQEDYWTSSVEVFIKETTSTGTVKLSEVYLEFINWMGPTDSINWTLRKFTKELDRLSIAKKRKTDGMYIMIGEKNAT